MWEPLILATMWRGFRLSLLPFVVAAAGVHGGLEKEIAQHVHSNNFAVEVDTVGNPQVMKRSSLLRKEQKSDRFILTDDAASLAEEGAASYISMTARSRFLPQYPTGPATCDGSKLECPADSSVDPCSLVTNCSWPLHHDCGFGGGGFKICLPNKDNPDKCESGAECLLRCTGVFAEERGDGSKGLPACKDLAPDGCNGYYAADPDYENNGRGSECALNEDKTCGVKNTCGVQNPPESLGEKQCRAPEVYKMASNGSCPTVMTRPGKECKTQCLKGFSPSVEKLLCQEGGDFEPKAFSCTANPCTVLTVANALQSGCKEGPDTGAAVIESGLVCTTQCKDGYYRSDDVLRCYAQTLTPATFTCEAPCPVPTVQNAAQTGVCKEASDKILPFTSCTTQCAPGYTPSVTSMSCRNAVFSPATVVCNPDPCPAPTGVEFAHRKGPCQEGPLITSGSACTTQCLAGYTPSVATLSCTAATFTPATFTCVPNPCAIPEIEQAAGNGCRGIRMGQKVDSGKACVAVCKPGWSPNIKKLDCYAEKLTPSTFACEPDPCPIPFAKNQEGSGCLGVPGRVDGTVIESGETCRTECKEGYHASVERMSCMTGSLTPPSWSCIEDRCPAEGGVANAGARICEEGNSIESGKLCTTKCNSGYTPNHASLQCRLGKLSPHTFVCNPNPCAVPGVANRLGSGCSGLPHPAMVDHGTTCMTQCEDGYTPTVAELRCAAGTLAPTTFSCSENPCDAPDGIQNGANQLCREGRTLQSGSLCTTQCADGYTPSVASLSCSLGKLSPRTFSCNPLPCNTPRVDNRQGNGCKGKRGNTIDSGATCTPQCRAGFTPSESELRCAATVLTPATFTCNPNPCAIPTVNKALGNGCNGVSGGMIDSGSKCQAACMPGYTPSVAQLGCFASVFIPASFTCRPDSCAFPSVQYKSGSGCAGVGGTTMSSGATCTTQCASGYTPDVGELKCFAGVFTPSSFECLPSPCNLPSVANAQGNGCKGKVGTVMASGGVCKTDCMPGFEPSAAQLQCTAGRLSPTSFSCDELRCRAPTGLANAPSVGCAEGSRVRGGASCTPRCNAGYTPTVASLACKQGVFDPTTYACQPQGCSIPGVANAKNPRCAEGNNIAHGQRCTPECNDGFVASQSALSCMAGSLTPSSFSCLAPCTAPSVADSHQSGFCREGNRISHGGSCTAQCKAGFSATRGSLECNNGRLQGTASCQIEMPAMGASFYNCWSGDPHFTCRNGRRSDPLVPGTHWVLKQSCPNSPNFMWIQGLYGPVSPSGAFGVAFGGMFLSKNVLTVRASNNPPWIVKWNDRNIQNSWTGSGGSWRYNLAGTNLVVSWNNRRIEVGLSYGVTYKANRHHWNRQNWRISGVFYNDWYTSNSLWSRLCRSGSYGGEAIDLPEPRWRWHPRGDDRMVSSAYDLFQRSRAEIEGRLNSLSSMASLFAEEEILQVNLSTVEEPKLCEGKALEEAKKSCAVLKKEGTEEEEEEIQEDEEAKDNQEQTYQACLADACMTHEKNFGDAGKETEEESEMESALKHKKELRVVAADGECKEGWQPTDPSENILSDEEKSRAEKRKNDCQVACKLCRPKRRRYLVGPLSLHNETRDACIAQRLAMPKNTEDVKRLWELQKEHCTADKGWLGGVYKEGGWKWDDGAFVAGIGSVTGSNGDYLCIDKEDGTLVNCEHRADTKHDALCEGVWY